MTDWLIDSSVVAKWLLTEADSPVALRAASEIQHAGGRLIVLDYALAEVANVLRTQLMRKVIDEPTARALFAAMQQLPVVIESSPQHLNDAFDLALIHNVAVYDALFLAGTVRLRCSGLTADESLYRSVATQLPAVKLLRNWPTTTP